MAICNDTPSHITTLNSQSVGGNPKQQLTCHQGSQQQ